MKLFELTESFIKHVNTKQHPNVGRTNKELGDGYEAKVYADKTGGTVIKELPIEGDVKDSATYQFIDQVMRVNNPFLPRIYSAKLYTSEAGGRKHQRLVIQMERLTEFDSEKVAHLMPQLFAQLGIGEDDITFNNQAQRNVKRMKSDAYHTPAATDEKEQQTQDEERKNTLGALGDVLWSNARTPDGIIDMIKGTDNAQLKQAFKLIYDILKDHDARSSYDKKVNPVMKTDLHDKNVMVRLTPHGPQLVITDPVVTFMEPK